MLALTRKGVFGGLFAAATANPGRAALYTGDRELKNGGSEKKSKSVVMGLLAVLNKYAIRKHGLREFSPYS